MRGILVAGIPFAVGVGMDIVLDARVIINPITLVIKNQFSKFIPAYKANIGDIAIAMVTCNWKETRLRRFGTISEKTNIVTNDV